VLCSRLKNHEVLVHVVVLDGIDVVDDRADRERTPEHSFHDQIMLAARGTAVTLSNNIPAIYSRPAAPEWVQRPDRMIAHGRAMA